MGWAGENGTLSGGQWLVGGAAQMALTLGLEECCLDERCLLDLVLAGAVLVWPCLGGGIVVLKLGGPAYHLIQRVPRFDAVGFGLGSLEGMWLCLKLRKEVQNLVLGF